MNRYMMGKIYHILKSCGKKIKVITLIHDVDFLRNVPKANGNVDDMEKSGTISVITVRYNHCT